MPAIDRAVLLEAISALTGSAVRPLAEGRGEHSPHEEELTITNFLPTVFSPSSSADPPSPCPASPALPEEAALSELSLWGASASMKELLVDMENFLDPLYDYDFRCGSGSSECSRGGEPYTRPWGWYRFALKVLDKYPDGNAWLGSYGWRSQSSPGEWPVSFHGTSIEGARGITGSHYKTDDGQCYGRGIYSTPNIDIAEGYTMFKEFRSKNGRTYEVIMQNRINPKKRVITGKEDYWLIPVPEGSSAEQEKQVVEASIRPYGILIKEV
ncbi:uncharacterized protein [Salminus brasiliensis]|uniref:uncharacterized protein n=1 Tax=Salminus brasiliensis TaxID=930266 RepID=UPI003B838131